MTTGKKMKFGKKASEALKKSVFSEYTPRHKLTSGYMIREMRELQGLTQEQLAKKAGTTQAAISALEKDRSTLGLERAKVIARALKVHPSVLAFPGWDIEEESAA